MKRDLDLIRTILEQVEEKSQGIGQTPLSIPDHSQQEISYHIKLLCESGLVKGHDCSSSFGLHWVVSTLTSQGHDFLDAIRNDTVWNSVKEKVKSAGGSVTLEIVKTLATQALGALYGIATGS